MMPPAVVPTPITWMGIPRALARAIDCSTSPLHACPSLTSTNARAFGDRPQLSYASGPMAAARGADALVVVTEWTEFRSPDFDELKRVLKLPLVFDGRNLYEPALVRAAGLEHFSIGRH